MNTYYSIYIYIYIYDGCNLFSTFSITLFRPFRFSSGNLPDSFRDEDFFFTYLLTGLLTDLLTEREFTAYGAAYGDCLQCSLTKVPTL